MNHTTFLAHAAASEVELKHRELPKDVQWMPPGRQTVQPMGFDEPFEMDVTPAIALQANIQLQEMRRLAAAGLDAEPYFDFNHKDEIRSFIPTRLFWAGDHPKDGGIRAEGRWTGTGAKAVIDGEQCCISAAWVLDKITKAFRGIRHNLGGLVPRSAFNSVQAFAKSGSAADALLDGLKLSDTDRTRLAVKYGVDMRPRVDPSGLPLEKDCPFEILVNRISEKQKIPGDTILWRRLMTQEPELWKFHLQQEGRIDHSEHVTAAGKASSEFMRQVDNLVSTGMEFAQASAKVALHAPHLYEEYVHTFRKGGYADTVGAVLTKLQTTNNKGARHAFIAAAKSFASVNRMNETQAQFAFAKTEPGQFLLSQC